MATTVSAPRPARPPAAYERSALWGWLATTDHKRIAALYLYTALSFFVVGGFEALLIRWQLLVPRSTFLGPDS